MLKRHTRTSFMFQVLSGCKISWLSTISCLLLTFYYSFLSLSHHSFTQSLNIRLFAISFCLHYFLRVSYSPGHLLGKTDLLQQIELNYVCWFCSFRKIIQMLTKSELNSEVSETYILWINITTHNGCSMYRMMV